MNAMAWLTPVIMRLGRYGRYCLADGVAKRSLAVALIVGSVLNLINQGDALWGRQPIDIVKLILTFMVPFGVSTYGAVSYRLRHERQIDPGQKPERLTTTPSQIGNCASPADGRATPARPL